ncbi:unnamed protein product [Closterium sp. Naga37s-1]|nr:unnamed protein product [Closterium sp. Naga37s-1]
MASRIPPSLAGSAHRANILKMWRHAIAVRVGRFNEVEQCAMRSPRASLGFSPLRPPVAKPPSKKPRPRDVMGTAATVKPRAVHSGQATVAAVAAKATPVKATPVKATQAKATLAKATPAKATPAKATPAKATQAKATQAKATQAKVLPAKVLPAKASPAKVTPAKVMPPAKASRASPTVAVGVKAAGASSPAAAAAPATSAPHSPKSVVGEMGGVVEECGTGGAKGAVEELRKAFLFQTRPCCLSTLMISVPPALPPALPFLFPSFLPFHFFSLLNQSTFRIPLVWLPSISLHSHPSLAPSVLFLMPLA